MRKAIGYGVALVALVYILSYIDVLHIPTDKDYYVPQDTTKAPIPPDTARYYKPIYPKKENRKQVEIYN